LSESPRPGVVRHEPTSLAVDSLGYAHVAAASLARSFGYSDAVYHLIDPNGNHVWHHHVPASSTDGAWNLGARLALDAGGDLYTVAVPRGRVSSARHPSVLSRVFTHSFAEVARFERDALPIQTDPTDPRAGEIHLEGPYPNPVRGGAQLSLMLERESVHLRITMYDVLGRRVAVLHDGPMSEGEHMLGIDAGKLATGTYFVRVVGEGTFATRRFTVFY
jgi:hypothetical protein